MTESTEPAAFSPCLDDTPSDDDFVLVSPELPDPNIPDPLGADKERRKEIFAQIGHLCFRGMLEPSNIYADLVLEAAKKL